MPHGFLAAPQPGQTAPSPSILDNLFAAWRRIERVGFRYPDYFAQKTPGVRFRVRHLSIYSPPARLASAQNTQGEVRPRVLSCQAKCLSDGDDPVAGPKNAMGFEHERRTLLIVTTHERNFMKPPSPPSISAVNIFSPLLCSAMRLSQLGQGTF